MLKLNFLKQSDPTTESLDQPNNEAEAVSLPPSSEPLPNEAEAPTHFDHLITETTPTTAAASGGAMLSKEEFHKVFCMAFNIGSSITRISALSVNERDSSAIECSKALFETAEEIPALHFLLQPGGKWGGRILAIGAFAIPMALNVRQEIAARNSSGGSNAGSEQSGLDMLKNFE